MWIVPFHDRISIVLLLTFKHFRFLSVLRTVYTHRLYARGKHPAALPKSFEFQVWIWRRFLLVTGSKGSWYTTVKATKPLTGTVVTWNCFAHFLRMGFRQTSFKTASLSLYWQLLRSLVLKSLVHSKTATLTRKLLRWRFLHFVCINCVLCKRSVVRSVPFFCTFHFVSGWRDRCVSFPQ